MEHSQTENLLSRYRSGDRQALDQVLETFRPFLRRIVELRMDPTIRARVDSSDVVQEAQLEVARRMDDYLERRPMSFRVWLRLTVCQRMASLRRFHTAACRNARREIPLPEQSSLSLAQMLLHSSPSARASRRERAEIVRQAVARLPEPDREILLLRNGEQFTNLEASERLGLDPAATSKRYARALLRLRTELRHGGHGTL